MQEYEKLVIERSYNAPIERLWKAITDKDDMKQWCFNVAAFTPEVGFEFSFEGGKNGNHFVHICKITEVVPGKKIAYSWRNNGYAGQSFVTFELFEDSGTTKLRLTHEGLETFAGSHPHLEKESFEKGWGYLTGTALRQFLEKEQ